MTDFGELVSAYRDGWKEDTLYHIRDMINRHARALKRGHIVSYSVFDAPLLIDDEVKQQVVNAIRADGWEVVRDEDVIIIRAIET